MSSIDMKRIKKNRVNSSANPTQVLIFLMFLMFMEFVSQHSIHIDNGVSVDL